jgi:hypothetical protein
LHKILSEEVSPYLLPINDLVTSFEDFKDLISLKQMTEQSSAKIKLFKLKYLNTSGKLVVMRIELNLKKHKISYGLWKANVLHTKKFSSYSTN